MDRNKERHLLYVLQVIQVELWKENFLKAPPGILHPSKGSISKGSRDTHTHRGTAKKEKKRYQTLVFHFYLHLFT